MKGIHGARTIVLSTLNATYMHSSLALRSLRAFCGVRTDWDFRLKEFTINQRHGDIIADLYLIRPAVLAFSCYIWNISPILEICADYKKAAPDTVIILGGPEVSYNAAEVLASNSAVDYVVNGEGEKTLDELLSAFSDESELAAIQGISYRNREGIPVVNPSRDLIVNLDDLPFAYANQTDDLRDRVVYYESTRGCPFSCTYCLSASSTGVRSLSIDRVKSDLAVLLALPLREIKFVDRTFNLDEKRVRTIIKYILGYPSQVKIHFEINAELFSDNMIDFLEKVPPGRFNFEIGIQSTFQPALQAVGRKQNLTKLSNNITRLALANNIHLHLDLIAGLPGEDYDNFKESFNMAYGLQPHMLQLGFLKVLKGSPLINDVVSFQYVFQSHPPYQVISNRDLSFENVLNLTRIEELVDLYYNSREMVTTLQYITGTLYKGSAANFYEDFSAFWSDQEWWGRGHRKEALFTFLSAFIENFYPDHRIVVNELLKFDYLINHHRYTLPQGMSSHNPDNLNNIVYSYAKDKAFVHRHFPQWEGMTPREVRKLLHIEYFEVDPFSKRAVETLVIMFVYNPITSSADLVIDLTNQEINLKIAQPPAFR